MDFLVKTDLSVFPESIDFNFSEIKAELEEKLSYYRNLVVTEDGIRAAKSEKAKLNKLAAAVEDRRKEVKAICLAPYNDFEAKCKELVALIKAPSMAIDTQIKTFEDAKKQQKYDELKAYYDENVKELADVVTLDKIINPKWGNVTLKADALKNEIGNTLERIRQELETINNEYADKPYKAAVLNEYCKDYSLSKALVYAAQLKRQDEMQKKILERSEPVHTEKTETEAKPSISAADSQHIIKGTFTVEATREKIIALRDFMRDNDIKYSVVK